ncbi:MAG: RluA family pseudouridine synthase [Deltaproteobacteria bacterium]|nr:RluA family pseudouridine synthase [Deltaproteobacteria bacterium]
MNARTFEFEVTGNEKDSRIDVFLARQDINLSRSQIKKAADDGHLQVNRQAAKAGYKLKEGDMIRLYLPESVPSNVVPQDIPLTILFEDPHILIVDKPAGMTVHPAAGHYENTLVNAILFHCRDLSGIGGVLRPGIVHRLDKGTSGMMIVAKTDDAHHELAAQFKKHEIKKTYQALVYGQFQEDSGTIDIPIGRHPVDRKKMSTKSRRGKEAVTYWQVCERYGAVTLLEIKTETGRTHQIRVHLTVAGYPLLGDGLYGNPKRINTLQNMAVRRKIKSLNRHALHASAIEFCHPVQKISMAFSSPMPADMADLCDLLQRGV